MTLREEDDEESEKVEENGKFTCSRESSASGDSMSRVEIAEVTDFGDFRSLSTSAVLSVCKHTILRPYLRLLAVMGFRNFGSDGPRILTIFNHLYLVQAVLFTLLGHVLQYLACFRRDRGLSCGHNDFENFENATFGWIVPGLLHFFGYGYVLYLLRFKETERLENLMEKTFLLSAHRTNCRKSRLVERLWIFICIGVFWVLASLCSVSFLVAKGDFDAFRWLHSDARKISFKIALVATVLWQDMIQATVITSYCLQVQLLTSSLYFLREKLLQHTIQPLSWIREINECQNVLNYLNRDFSPGVCIFIFLDASWIISTLIWFFKKDSGVVCKIPIMVAGGLWLVAVLAPFALAAHLTSACTNLRRSGHEVRIRPFVYLDTPGEDLDTILLYTSTLKMKAKLFSVPVAGPYLCLCFALISLSVVIAGQSLLF